MIIGILKVDFFLPHASSLKEKRMVLRGIKDRVRENFNVSVSEVDDHEKWQRAKVGIAAIGTDKQGINSLLDKVLNFLSEGRNFEIINHEMELI